MSGGSRMSFSNFNVLVLAACFGIVAAELKDNNKLQSSTKDNTVQEKEASKISILPSRKSRVVLKLPTTFEPEPTEDTPHVTIQRFPFDYNNQFWMMPQTRPGRSNDMIPMIRYGRSDSMIPSVRFGRSDSLNGNGGDMIPQLRFGRSDVLIPTLRFGKSAENEVDGKADINLSSNRVKRSLEQKSPATRSKRGGDMIPTIRFGRSDSIIPSIRFGRSDSLIPSLRFGRSDSLIPTLRFGRSFQKKDNGMIPVFRFGRSSDSMIPSLRFGRKTSKNIFIPNTKAEDLNLLDESIQDISAEEEEEHIETKRHIDDSESMIPYPRLGRDSESEERNETNDSLIPQIRYGKSLNSKSTKEEKVPYFLLPNIRPGRSYKQVMLGKSEYPQVMLPYPRPGRSDIQSDSTYYSSIDDFFDTIFGVFRRSDRVQASNGKGLSSVVHASHNTNLPTTSTEKVVDDEDSSSMYIIPYPRPGKRNLLNSIKTDSKTQNPKSYNYKNSDYLLPYPRPGKKNTWRINDSGEQDDLMYQKRSSNMIPLPRPGRSGTLIPRPRLGRSGTLVPQPRLGRSTVMSQYSRPGRSGNMIPFPRPGRSDLMIPFPRPGRS